VHELARGQLASANPDGTHNPWPTFEYRGGMRPHYPLSPRRTVPDEIARPDYATDPEGASCVAGPAPG
jgi:methionyl aminopeptidase